MDSRPPPRARDCRWRSNGASNEGGHSYMAFRSSGPLNGFKRSLHEGGAPPSPPFYIYKENQPSPCRFTRRTSPPLVYFQGEPLPCPSRSDAGLSAWAPAVRISDASAHLAQATALRSSCAGRARRRPNPRRLAREPTTQGSQPTVACMDSHSAQGWLPLTFCSVCQPLGHSVETEWPSV